MTRALRVAAVGDLHCTVTSEGAFQSLFAKIAESADVLALCGDLTDYGTPDEARVLAKELAATRSTLNGHTKAGEKKGDERKAFMSECLKADKKS